MRLWAERACKTTVDCGRFNSNLLTYAQNPLDSFPRSLPVDREVANFFRKRVTDLLATRRTISTCQDSSQCRQQVRNKLATGLLCRCNGIWETTRHNSLQTQRTFARANVLRTCYGFAAGKLRVNWCNGVWPTTHSRVRSKFPVSARSPIHGIKPTFLNSAP